MRFCNDKFSIRIMPVFIGIIPFCFSMNYQDRNVLNTLKACILVIVNRESFLLKLNEILARQNLILTGYSAAIFNFLIVEELKIYLYVYS